MEKLFFLSCLLPLLLVSCDWNKCFKAVYIPDQILEIYPTFSSISTNDTLSVLLKIPAEIYFDGYTYNFKSSNLLGGGSCTYINDSINFVFQQYFPLEQVFNIDVLKGDFLNDGFIGVLENDTFHLELKLNPKFIGLFAISIGGGLQYFEDKIDPNPKDKKCNHYYYSYKKQYWVDRNTREITNNFDLYYNSPFFVPEPGYNLTYEKQKEVFSRYYFVNIVN